MLSYYRYFYSFYILKPLKPSVELVWNSNIIWNKASLKIKVCDQVTSPGVCGQSVWPGENQAVVGILLLMWDVLWKRNRDRLIWSFTFERMWLLELLKVTPLTLGSQKSPKIQAANHVMNMNVIAYNVGAIADPFITSPCSSVACPWCRALVSGVKYRTRTSWFI